MAIGNSAALPAVAHPLRVSLTLIAVGIVYFVLAKSGLALASIHPSASPIWPPTGFAIAMVLLCGYRVLPAIFVAAWAVNETTAGSFATSIAIAAGNSLEALVGAALVNRWSGGLRTFDTPAGVARFALIASVPATMISATIGAGSLALAGYAPASAFAPIWFTWWLGDLAGALVVTPVLVLWARQHAAVARREEVYESAALFLATVAVGLIAFSPLIEQTPLRGPLAFLAILPLLWAALRRCQRDTATTALILCAFAVWGTLAEGGPFGRATLNESFLMLVTFMISTAVPSLALSADVAERRRTEADIAETVAQRDDALRRLDSTAQTLAAILSATDDPIYLFDADKRYRYIGAAGLRAIGKTADEIIGRTWQEAGLPAEIMAPVEAHLDRILSTGESITADAEYPPGAYWEYRMNPVREPDGRIVGIVATSRDVTAHKRAEQAMQESESRLRRAQEAGGISNWEWRLDEPVRWWSEGMYRLVGRDAATFVPTGERVLETIHPADRQRVRAEFRKVLSGESHRFEAEFRTIWPDGTVRWLVGRADAERVEGGLVRKLVGICFDATERRRAQDSLLEREKHLSIVIDKVPTGITHTDAEGRFLLINDRFCEFVGRSRDELIGRRYSEFIHPEDRPKVDETRAAAMASGEPYSLRRRYIRPDGSVIWADVYVTIVGGGDVPQSALAVIIDLTEQLRAEERQELLMNELNHRVKNTLASVQSLAVLTMRHAESPAAFNQAFLSRLQALSTTHNLLTEAQWEGASLGDLVTDELKPYAPRDERRVVLYGDPVDLEPAQVISFGLFFHELATNAAKYGALSNPTGQIVVSWNVDREQGEPVLMMRWQENGGPPVSPPSRQGFGSRLIEQTIKEALGGTIEITYAREGIRCAIAVPL